MRPKATCRRSLFQINEIDVTQGELVEVGLSMKAPLEKVADNLPPPTRPAPLTSADERRSGYGGLGTRWTSWERLQVRPPCRYRVSSIVRVRVALGLEY